MSETDWHRIEDLKTKCSVCGRNLHAGFLWFWPYPEAEQCIMIETFCGAGCRISKFGFMKEVRQVDISLHDDMETVRRKILGIGMKLPE